MPGCTSWVTELSSWSPMTLSVTRPAVRAVTATVMVSPGRYSGLSSAISSMSGVSAVASVYQPASKRDRGHRPVRLAARDFEPIAAPLHRRRDAAGLVGGDVDPAVGDAAGELDRLVVPAAVAAIPLVARLDLEQFVAQAAARRASCRRARRARRRSVAVSPSPSERPENSGLTPIMLPVGDDRQRQLALDRAAAGFRHAHDHLRLERAGRGRQLVEADLEARLALVVGLRQVLERLRGWW